MKKAIPASIALVLLVLITSCFLFENKLSPLTNFYPAKGGTLIGPEVTFRWDGGTYGEDQTLYSLLIGTSEDTLTEVASEMTSVTLDLPLICNTRYFWKVVARASAYIAESEVMDLYLIDGTAKDPLPSDKAAGISPDTLLSWEMDGVEGADYTYSVYLSEGSIPYLVHEGLKEDSFDPGDLKRGTKYSWKIAVKAGGQIKDGPLWSFTTDSLPTPLNPYPSEDATSVPWDSVTLSWEVNGDTANLYYDVYFGRDEIPAIYRIGQTATELTISDLDRGEDYFWQIVVTDEPYSSASDSKTTGEDLIQRKDSAAAIGEIWRFTTKENLPPALVSMSPSNGAIDISPEATLSWEFTDEDGDGLLYDIYFEGQSDPHIILSNLDSNQYSPDMEYYLKDYYWKVVAKDGYGGRTETTVCKLTTHLIEWQKCLGGRMIDEAVSVKESIDGGHVVVGATRSNDGDVSGNHGDFDFWVVKLNSLGDISWQRCLGGSSEDSPSSMQQTSDGGYIVVGETYSNNGDVSGNHGAFDCWIVRLDSAGEIIWQKCLGGTEYDYANFVQQTSDGGYIIAGKTNSCDGDVLCNHGDYDYWIVKLDSMGNIDWQKCLGGSGEDSAQSVRQTFDGGYIVAGHSSSIDGDVSANHGRRDYWIVKLDSAGNIEWQQSMGGSENDYAHSILQTSEGGFIVVGESMSFDGDVSGNNGYYDCWIVKTDSMGGILWQECLGGTFMETALSIQQTPDEGYVVAGVTNSNDRDVYGNHGLNDSWVVKLDPYGTILWQKCLGGSDQDGAFSIESTVDGSFVVTGRTGSNDGDVRGLQGLSDCWIVRTGILGK